MTDAVDEYCMEALTEYEGKQAIRDRESEKKWQGRPGKFEKIRAYTIFLLKVRSSTMLLRRG